MIYYVIKIDFANNLLVPVEGFNRYQSSGKKKGRAGVEPGPWRLENLGLPLRGSKSFKVQAFQQP